MFADDSDMSDLSFDPGPKHSTPVKKVETGARQNGALPVMSTNTGLEKVHHIAQASTTPASVLATAQSALQLHAACDTISKPVHIKASDTSGIVNVQMARKEMDSLVVEQRKEIASLMAELRERDHELNELVKSHQNQLSVWEQDRQLILRLQHKCQRLAAELKQQKQRAVKSSGERGSSEDFSTQAKQNKSSSFKYESLVHLQQLQTHSENLNDSLKEATMAKGQLQAREQELTTLLKLREESLAEAERSIGELKSQVKSVQQEKEDSESQTQQLVNTLQHRCHRLKEDKDKLVTACQEKDRQLQQATAQLEDMIQQALMLQQALSISCDREKNKEELLGSVKARQERLILELNQLRNLYKRQNREMTLLQLTVDTSIESDPDPGDRDRQPAPMARARANTSFRGNSHSLSPLHTCTTQPQHSRETQDQRQSFSANITHHSQTRCSCGSCENNMDRNSDHSTTAHNTQHCSSHHYRSRRNRISSSGDYNANNNSSVSNRSPGFENCRNLNTNNNSVNNSNNIACTPSDQSSYQEVYNSPKQSTQKAYQEPAPCDGDQSPPVQQDDREDAVNREQDVDTEIFWQKILSVRHGNQNNAQDTKDSTHPAVKDCLTDIHTEKDETDHYHTDSNNSAHVTQVSRESSFCWQNSSSPELLDKKGFSSPTAAVVGSGSETQQRGSPGIRFLPNNVPPVDSVYNDYEGAKHVTSQTSRSQEISMLRDSALASFSHSQPQRSVGEYSQDCSFSEGSASSRQHSHQTEMSKPDGNIGNIQTAVILQDNPFSDGDTSPDSALAASLQFDEKLSSFLESPEGDTSFDPVGSQGSCSPASKLHRLLLESQEMIKALEVKVLPDHY